VFTPFTALARQIGEMFSSPLAFFGGLVGMVVLCGALVAVFVYFPNVAVAAADDEEEEEFELEFEPGALVRLGPKPPEEVPEKQIVEETRVEEDSVEEAVTKDEEPPPPEEEPEKKEKPEKKKKSKDKVDPNKKKDVKVDDKNKKKNTPYDELPNVDELSGDPFGDPNGWADLKKDGDPWATAVMAALNGMQVPSYAAKGFKGQYRFELKICKDGTINKVYTKGSSGSKELDAAVQGELMKTKIPRPPAKISKKMKSNCVKLKYRFVWGSGKVK
jgi:outer membrane biosynthesis protein TonB